MATNGTDTDRHRTDDRTLRIRFRDGDDSEVEEVMEALDRGETPDPQFEVVYHDPADVHRVTRPKNLELLRAIVQHEPASIRETARVVDRDVRQVHRNLSELAELHLIDLVEDGQSKRPSIWYDTIELDLPLVNPDVGADGVKA